MPEENIEMATMSERSSSTMVNRSFNKVTKVFRLALNLLFVNVMLVLKCLIKINLFNYLINQSQLSYLLNDFEKEKLLMT